MTRRWREWVLLAVMAAPLALILSRPRIEQDLKYHALVDTRAFLGIPNFNDVVSNVAFLLVGVAGLVLCRGGRVKGASRSWSVFFLGVALVFCGSSYYHWTPNNATLVWDRLPMTIAFMGLFVALLSEHVEPGMERLLLAPAVAVGLGSVAWWAWTGDLRIYFWVQAAPLLGVGFFLAVYRARFTHRIHLAYALAAYVVAKVVEFHDREIYALTAEAVSGHTLKHLLAAAGIFSIYLMLRRRQPIEQEVPSRRAAAA